jgi:hypothetical protein
MPSNDPPIVHWSSIESPDRAHYSGDDEKMGLDAPFGRHFGLTRLGIPMCACRPAGAPPIRTPRAPSRSSCS